MDPIFLFYERAFLKNDSSALLFDFLSYQPSLFLCRVISKIPSLMEREGAFRSVFSVCLTTLKNSSAPRASQLNALKTMSMILWALSRRRFCSQSDMLSLLCGIENLDLFFAELSNAINQILMRQDVDFPMLCSSFPPISLFAFLDFFDVVS